MYIGDDDSFEMGFQVCQFYLQYRSSAKTSDEKDIMKKIIFLKFSLVL
jgi:hypothetical protein